MANHILFACLLWCLHTMQPFDAHAYRWLSVPLPSDGAWRQYYASSEVRPIPNETKEALSQLLDTDFFILYKDKTLAIKLADDFSTVLPHLLKAASQRRLELLRPQHMGFQPYVKYNPHWEHVNIVVREITDPRHEAAIRRLLRKYPGSDFSPFTFDAIRALERIGAPLTDEELGELVHRIANLPESAWTRIAALPADRRGLVLLNYFHDHYVVAWSSRTASPNDTTIAKDFTCYRQGNVSWHRQFGASGLAPDAAERLDRVLVSMKGSLSGQVPSCLSNIRSTLNDTLPFAKDEETTRQLQHYIQLLDMLLKGFGVSKNGHHDR